MQNNNIRVFVVDDEPIVARSVAQILSMSGFSAWSFTNPRQALDAASLDAPDLLVTDIVMPELTGIELAIQLKSICPYCKVLLFSGQAATVNFLANTPSLDGIVILSKPLHPHDLLAAIRQQGIDFDQQGTGIGIS